MQRDRKRGVAKSFVFGAADIFADPDMIGSVSHCERKSLIFPFYIQIIGISHRGIRINLHFDSFGCADAFDHDITLGCVAGINGNAVFAVNRRAGSLRGFDGYFSGVS